MRTYKKELKLVETEDKVICDVCKREATGVIDRRQNFENISFVADYDSAFSDGYRYEIDICSQCLKEKLGKWFRNEGPQIDLN